MRIRKTILALAFAFAALVTGLVTSPAAKAQDDKWPSKPVMVIVPFGAGGNADVLGRIYAERLSQRLGQQFVIENRAGAGGNTGVAAMAKAKPDGYTIGVGTASGLSINPHIYKEKMPFDAFKDIAPLIVMATQPNILAVHPSMPAKTLPELIDYLKANPDKENYATSGVGTTLHLCMEMLIQATGIKVGHVAYRASNQVMQDLISGQVRIACDNAATALEQVKANNIRAIAVTSPQRYRELPDTPTFAETIPGFDALTWHSYIAPAGTPKPILDKLIAELVAISKEPEVQKRLIALGVAPSGIAGEDFAKFQRKEFEKWGPVIEKAGIKTP